MAKFKVGDRVVDRVVDLDDEGLATVKIVAGEKLKVQWDADGPKYDWTQNKYWPASDFELIAPATKEPEMKYDQILEPREPVKAFKPKVGVYELSNSSELEVSRIWSKGKSVDLRFCLDNGGPWAMNKKAIAELIEVLQALHDAMDD